MDVVELFNAANKEFTQNEVDTDIVKNGYVTSDIYNFLVDSKLATTAKNSSVKVDTNQYYMFKGLVLHEVPDARFVGSENTCFVADSIGKAFAGFYECRTLTENADFFGAVMQSLIKYGIYVPDSNKKAIVKATLSEVPKA